MVPSSLRAYEDLNVKHEALKLITPQFETPLPPLQAAIFPPSFRLGHAGMHITGMKLLKIISTYSLLSGALSFHGFLYIFFFFSPT